MQCRSGQAQIRTKFCQICMKTEKKLVIHSGVLRHLSRVVPDSLYRTAAPLTRPKYKMLPLHRTKEVLSTERVKQEGEESKQKREDTTLGEEGEPEGLNKISYSAKMAAD